MKRWLIVFHQNLVLTVSGENRFTDVALTESDITNQRFFLQNKRFEKLNGRLCFLGVRRRPLRLPGTVFKTHLHETTFSDFSGRNTTITQTAMPMATFKPSFNESPCLVSRKILNERKGLTTENQRCQQDGNSLNLGGAAFNTGAEIGSYAAVFFLFRGFFFFGWRGGRTFNGGMSMLYCSQYIK